MKILRTVKIINWHYFWNQTLNIEPIVFLTGVNASGKSTLIDAMQVVLLGDTSGRHFNKAAAEKSNRTLRGYLRGELGDTLEGGFHYLRNGRFTSYIVLEFYDDVKDEFFNLGAVFDVYDDGGFDHRYFYLKAKMPENEFIEDNIPLEYKALNKFFQSEYPGKFKFFDTNRQYQDHLKKVLGNLKDKYFNLLKKAVSFSPITDITTFITEYVTESQKNIEIGPMQENILQYKKLEDEAALMRYKVERLSEINKNYLVYLEHKEKQTLSEYVLEKSTLQNDLNRLEAFNKQYLGYAKRLGDIESELADLDINLAELNKRKIKLIQDSSTNDTYRITDEINEHKKVAEEKIKSLNFLNMQVRSDLERYVMTFNKIANDVINSLASKDTKRFKKDGLFILDDFLNSAEEIIKVNNTITTILNRDMNELSEEILTKWRNAQANFKQNITAFTLTLGRLITDYEANEAILKQQEIDLRGGGKPYEYSLVQIRGELQNRLSAKFGHHVEVMIFSDLIDIKNPKWTNAIEGYLGAQRFYLFVEGQYFLEAYDILKGLLQQYNYYGTNLVDVDQIIERRFTAMPNSLAEEIMTDHVGARAYVDFLLGRLQKCNTIQEARNSGNGITPDTDLYRNFTFGRINPRNYAQKFIGRKVEEGEVNAKKAELAAHGNQLNIYKELYMALRYGNDIEIVNTNEISALGSQVKRIQELPALAQSVAFYEEELGRHDLTLIEGIHRRINLVETDIKGIEEQKSLLAEERGTINTNMSLLKTERIPETKQIINERQTKLDENYDAFFVEEVAEPFFQKLISEGKTPLEINSEFRNSYSTALYLANSVFNQVKRLRKEYVVDYRLTFETEVTHNDQFDAELNDLQEVKLPEYEIKINDAYQKAVKQFKDDFISKLRNAIETVEDQIAELNIALSTSTFGEDSYQFTVRPSSVYRPYYDMIKDDLLLEVTDDDSEFFTKYTDVMKDLFGQIVLAGDGDKNAAVLANVEKFTDYRNYLDFDLIVKDKDGNEQRLSRMLMKKSGGETQTPFYISVLASFAYLYRVNEPGELSNSARLIIFDEAFSKMDSGRIKEAIRLLRRFGLQAIISAPSDKVGDISPLVDETLVVLRGKNYSQVQLFAREEDLS